MKRTAAAFILGFGLAMMMTAGAGPSSHVAAQTDAGKSDFISTVRVFAERRIELDDLGQSITARYNALDLGNVLTNADFTGANQGVTKTQLVAVITSIAADHATFASGHNTNYHRLK